MQIELTEAFKQLNLNKYPSSVHKVILYILLNKPEDDNRVKIRVRESYSKVGLTIPTLVCAIKKLREVGFIEKIGQSEFLINSKYIK
jgi:DNA-binding MarR family transcriptional regulator